MTSAPITAYPQPSPATSWSSISPRPHTRQASSDIKLGKRPAPAPIIIDVDSSDLDRVSPASFPSGIPPPEPPAGMTEERQEDQPPAKRSRPSTPTLPGGPATITLLRVLLQPEYVELYPPSKLFGYVRQRDTKNPTVKLSAPDLKEILETMAKVNEAWLKTMGEDEVCLQCLAMWLRWFINNPKPFEGCVPPLLLVGLSLFHFHPPLLLSIPRLRPRSLSIGTDVATPARSRLRSRCNVVHGPRRVQTR